MGITRQPPAARPRRLGAGPDVFPIALGCMGMSDLYGSADSRGLLAGSRPEGARDLRGHLPRFAAEMGCTATQLAIAWVLAKGPGIVPRIGARTRAQLSEALGALDVRLSPGDIDRIEAAVPAGAVAGTRYDAHQMRILDSERQS